MLPGMFKLRGSLDEKESRTPRCECTNEIDTINL